jgi:hypothetical protein
LAERLENLIEPAHLPLDLSQMIAQVISDLMILFSACTHPATYGGTVSRARFRASCCAGACASWLGAASANNSIAFDPANLAPIDAAACAEIGQALKQSRWPADQGFDARLFGAHFHHAAKRCSVFVAKLLAYEFGEEHRVSINHGHPECGSCGAPGLFPPPSIRNKPPLSRV